MKEVDVYVALHPCHIRLKATSARECLWVGCVVDRLAAPPMHLL